MTVRACVRNDDERHRGSYKTFANPVVPVDEPLLQGASADANDTQVQCSRLGTVDRLLFRCLKKQKDSLAVRLERERTAQAQDDEPAVVSLQVLKALRTAGRAVSTARLARHGIRCDPHRLQPCGGVSGVGAGARDAVPAGLQAPVRQLSVDRNGSRALQVGEFFCELDFAPRRPIAENVPIDEQHVIRFQFLHAFLQGSRLLIQDS